MDKTKYMIVNLLLLLFSAFGFISFSYIVFRILKYSENHIGWNILYLIPLFLAIIALSLLRLYLNQWTGFINYFLLLFGFISIVAIFGIYYFNILIPYEIWLKRGMPERPF